MGKVKRSRGSKLELEKAKRQTPLSNQILEDDSVRPTGRTKQRQGTEDDDEYVDEKLSRKILEQARSQQEELESEHGISGTSRGNAAESKKGGTLRRTTSLGKPSQLADSDESSDEDEGDELAQNEEIYDKFDVNEEDEKALEMFLSHNPPVRRTLADIIQEKITEKKTEIQSQMSDNASVVMQQLDDRVVKMYRSIAGILRKYRSGKLPKAFKIIPALNNWEQILYLTDPEGWSAAAVYQATRIFASNLNAKMAQRFFNLVLLPRIRDDITEFKRLNFHLFMALRKALFKPAAFFKGILLPLCESGTCVLREAIIIASVLLKNSIPMLHSAAAILKIAEMPYNGANSIFLRTLLDKKYALPYRVIDAVVFHFLSFQQDKRVLPVLWHQCLLTFVQRYKEDMSSEQKSALIDLVRAHTHHQITAEIRREIIHSRCRGEEGTGVEEGNAREEGEMQMEGDG